MVSNAGASHWSSRRGPRLEPEAMGELAARAQAGDGSGCEALVTATYVETATLARRLRGSADDARAVVQDAYRRADRSLDRFRGEARFTTWLYRITANCASTHLGRRRRHRHEELVDELVVVESRPDLDPSAQAEAADLRDRISEALEDLPPKLRAVVVL